MDGTSNTTISAPANSCRGASRLETISWRRYLPTRLPANESATGSPLRVETHTIFVSLATTWLLTELVAAWILSLVLNVRPPPVICQESAFGESGNSEDKCTSSGKTGGFGGGGGIIVATLISLGSVALDVRPPPLDFCESNVNVWSVSVLPR